MIADDITVRRANRAFVPPSLTPKFTLRLCPDADLNDTALDEALSLLGGEGPGHHTLVCTEANREIAELLTEERGFALTVLPAEIMPNAYSWAVVSAKSCVYSVPIA